MYNEVSLIDAFDVFIPMQLKGILTEDQLVALSA